MNEQTLSDWEIRMLSFGDHLNEQKLQDLHHKFRSGKFNIAFCGHFSAGKSSIINRLCNHALLPSSPIPTSANVVTIRNGPTKVQVTHSDPNKASGETRVESIDLELLAQYCQDGVHIK